MVITTIYIQNVLLCDNLCMDDAWRGHRAIFLVRHYFHVHCLRCAIDGIMWKWLLKIWPNLYVALFISLLFSLLFSVTLSLSLIARLRNVSFRLSCLSLLRFNLFDLYMSTIVGKYFFQIRCRMNDPERKKMVYTSTYDLFHLIHFCG